MYTVCKPPRVAIEEFYSTCLVPRHVHLQLVLGHPVSVQPIRHALGHAEQRHLLHLLAVDNGEQAVACRAVVARPTAAFLQLFSSTQKSHHASRIR